ncbi:MAG TPA: sel1 repeat family protein, partial [Methylococcales bacterium]|nr:sel1 repeat family protein [Methylococcales bacterium]
MSPLNYIARLSFLVQQNYKETVKWYRKATEQGLNVAQSNLGTMYYNGHGVHQNYKEAAKLWRKAAEQGNSGAQYNLGVIYQQGKGVLQDYVMA